MPTNSSPLYRLSLGAKLWRLWVPREGLLLVELREGQSRTVRYETFSLPQLKPLGRLKVAPTAWWTGVQGFDGGTAYLYELRDGESPIPARVLAFDLESGRQKWVAEGRTLLGHADKRLIVEHPDKESTWRHLDAATGAVLFEGPVDPTLPITPLRTGGESLQLPLTYLPGSEHYETVAAFVAEELGALPVGPVDYLAEKGVLSLSAHLEAEGGLEAHWLVLDEDGERLHHQQLGTGLRGLGLDSFVLLPGALLAIDQTDSLCVFSLP